MTEPKVVPHMTDLYKIIENERYFRLFLEEIRDKEVSFDKAVNIFVDLPIIDFAESTSRRYIGSLSQFSFLIKEKKKEDKSKVFLSKYSLKYLDGELNYEDYVLKCLCRNLEWAHFLPDIHEIINRYGPVSKKELIDYLDEYNYETSSTTTPRYLYEILRILDVTNVIKYQDGIATTSSETREKNEINKFAQAVQRELINLLQMAERREGVQDRTLRRLYHNTVKAYIPRRKHRTKALNTLEETEEIRKMVTSEDREESKREFKSKWELVDELWRWQKEFRKKWMMNYGGIAKVVTGAGKTHLALAIIESLKKENDELKVTIIVPTIVLMEQWHETLIDKLQISPNDIGRRGGGFKDDFTNNNILISVINSAIKNDFIKKETEKLDKNFLIVDECHRAGAPQFRNVFNARRNWELGLSATPERERDDAFENVLVDELGPIIGSYDYKDALDDGIIPEFNIYNYAILLNQDEKRKYERITKEIRKIIERLKRKYPFLEKPETNFAAALHSIKEKNNDRDVSLYFQKTRKRKEEIVYPAKNRKKLVKNVIASSLPNKNQGKQFGKGSQLNLSEKDRVMLFHEFIDEVNSLFMELDSKFVSIYHSRFPNSLNKIGLKLYKSGSTNVLLSVKALIEGVDVPKTNVGIIMASSSSIKQRIQSLGRVLRKAEGKEETKLIIPYVKDTIDEKIYHKKDWDDIVGKKNIEFKMFTEYGEIEVEKPKPPQTKKYQDIETIDENKLNKGDKYPGSYEGESYSFDHKGRLFEKTNSGRNYVNFDLSELWKEFRKFKPTGGKLKINKLGHILTSIQKDEDYKILYLGNIKNFNKKAYKSLIPTKQEKNN